MDAFQKEFCIYCLNKDCSRSGGSNMLFERRATNWYKDLFESPLRLDENDEKARKIISIWTPPPKFESEPVIVKKEPESIVIPEEVKTDKVENPPEFHEESVEINPIPPAPTQPAPIPVKKATNTPFSNPGYVGGKPEVEEKIMEPGGTFTFGDDL